MVYFTLYSRTYCHLCDDMLAELKKLPSTLFSVSVVDVDADTTLIARFDERVPVLFGRHGQGPNIELCHYFFNKEHVMDFLLGS